MTTMSYSGVPFVSRKSYLRKFMSTFCQWDIRTVNVSNKTCSNFISQLSVTSLLHFLAKALTFIWQQLNLLSFLFILSLAQSSFHFISQKIQLKCIPNSNEHKTTALKQILHLKKHIREKLFEASNLILIHFILWKR